MLGLGVGDQGEESRDSGREKRGNRGKSGGKWGEVCKRCQVWDLLWGIRYGEESVGMWERSRERLGKRGDEGKIG